MDAFSRVTPRLYKPIYGTHAAPASPHPPHEPTSPEPFAATCTSRDPFAPPVELASVESSLASTTPHLYKPTLGIHAAPAPPHPPYEAFTDIPVAILVPQMSHHSTSDSKIEITTIKTTIDPSGRLPLLVAAVAADARSNAIPTYPILGLLKSALTGGRVTPNFILDVITCETSVRGIPVELARFNHMQSVSTRSYHASRYDRLQT